MEVPHTVPQQKAGEKCHLYKEYLRQISVTSNLREHILALLEWQLSGQESRQRAHGRRAHLHTLTFFRDAEKEASRQRGWAAALSLQRCPEKLLLSLGTRFPSSLQNFGCVSTLLCWFFPIFPPPFLKAPRVEKML